MVSYFVGLGILVKIYRKGRSGKKEHCQHGNLYFCQSILQAT